MVVDSERMRRTRTPHQVALSASSSWVSFRIPTADESTLNVSKVQWRQEGWRASDHHSLSSRQDTQLFGRGLTPRA